MINQTKTEGEPKGLGYSKGDYKLNSKKSWPEGFKIEVRVSKVIRPRSCLLVESSTEMIAIKKNIQTDYSIIHENSYKCLFSGKNHHANSL